MKTALHSVSYAGFWSGQIQLTLEQFLEKASHLGYEAVMLVAKRPHLSLLDASSDRLDEIRALLGRHNFQLACIAGYTDFCAGVDHSEIPHREMQIFYVVELAKIASKLGGNLVRVFTGYERPDISYDQQWNWCVESLAECASRAADLGVTIGVQNHHDIAAHHDSLYDLLMEIDHPNCKAMFDAWSPALQGVDLVSAAKKMAPLVVHTTVADYVNRPRFFYQSRLINYKKQQDIIRAVPMGEGFIDYSSFFNTLKANGYDGYVAYEMCSVMEGGGSVENLDRCARQFVDYMKDF